jgi:hypothetical protein
MTNGKDNEIIEKIRLITPYLNVTFNFASRENAVKQRHLIVLYVAHLQSIL